MKIFTFLLSSSLFIISALGITEISDQAQLTNKYWELTQFTNDKKLTDVAIVWLPSVPITRKPHIYFNSKSNKFRAFDGCYQITGDFKQDNQYNKLEFGDLISEEENCQGLMAKVSNNFSTLLNQEIFWTIKNGNLVLHTEDNRMLVFSEAGEKADEKIKSLKSRKFN